MRRGRGWARSPRRPGCRRSACATRWDGWRPAGRARRPGPARAAQGWSRAAGVSTFGVRNALGRVAARGQGTAAGTAAGSASLVAGDGEQRPGAVVPVLPDPVPRDEERALARWGLLGEGAEPVFTAGARYPLAGLLLALPALEGTGLLGCARQVYGRLRSGYYGLAATLLTLVFLAL